MSMRALGDRARGRVVGQRGDGHDLVEGGVHAMAHALPSSQPLSNATISKRRLSCSSNSSAARIDVAWLRNSPPR